MDLDHFKSINDRHGHDAGDTALRHVSEIVTAQLRPSDLFARIGGEEFAILLPETESGEAVSMLERILKVIKRTWIQYEDQQIALSFSAGVAEYRDDATLDELIRHADEALYSSKVQGRFSVSLSLTDNTANT